MAALDAVGALCRHRVSKTDRGFAWIVLFSSFLLQFLIDGVLSSYGACLPALTEYSNKTISELSVPNSLQSGMFLMGGPLAAALVNRWGMLAVALTGSILMCSSIFFSSMIYDFSGFVTVYGFICGLGFSFMAVPAIVAVNLYFARFRPLANGLSSAGAGLGYVLMPMAMKLLVTELHFRRALRVLGGITTAAVLASLFLWPFVEEVTVVEKEEKEEEKSMIATHDVPVLVLPDEHRPSLLVPHVTSSTKPFYSMPSIEQPTRKVTFSSLGNVNVTLETHVVRPLSRKDIFYSGFVYEVGSRDNLPEQRNGDNAAISDDSRSSWWRDLMKTLDFALFFKCDFLLIVIMAAVTQLAYFIPFVYLNDYASQVHSIPDSQILVIGVVLGVCNTVGRICGGLLANIKWMNPFFLNTISLLLCSGISFCVPFFSTFPLLLTYTAVQGFALAVSTTLQPVLLIRATNLFRFTAGVGNMNLVKGIASFVGTPIAGALVEATGTYNAVFFWAGGCFFAAVAPLVLLGFLSHRNASKSSSKDTLSSALAGDTSKNNNARQL